MKQRHYSEYDKDFYAWAMQSAELIRLKKFSELDIEHVAEELEGMARSDKRALVNRLAILLAHLLKYKFQAHRQSNSWKNTIKTQRFDLQELLEESPSLTYELEARFHRAYEKAKLIAINETGLAEKDFPNFSPFTFTECLSNEFFPE